MPDDLDDLLRRTMKSLDDQVPSGYFDALPNQTLARLEAGMQSTPGTSEQARGAGSVPPSAPPAKRDEDSGLHDIRNLAQSTKQRISRRASTPPPDDVLAQTSGGWKAIALPEPAKMVALPSLDELPSKKEVLAKERAAAAVEAPAASVEARSSQRPAFSLPSAPKKSRAGLYIAGTLVAAAAGVVIFFQLNKEEDTKQASVAMNTAAAPATPMATAPAAAPAKEAPKVEPIPQPEPADPHAAGAGSAAVTGDVDGTPPAETKPDAKVETKALVPPKGSRGKKTTTKTTSTIDKTVSKPPETKNPPPPPDNKKVDTGKKGSGSGENEPSFDDLLKQAGVDEKKKADKPKLEKKELTQDDFKAGMGKVNVTKCYKGTQGNAIVKVKVAPSGKISAITVSGVPQAEGDCVAAAVRGVSFQAWDGSPYSATYTYLLAE